MPPFVIAVNGNSRGRHAERPELAFLLRAALVDGPISSTAWAGIPEISRSRT
jgi:sulfite reductase beta subunit-like hemoprotein